MLKAWLVIAALLLCGGARAQLLGGRGAELPLNVVVTPHFSVIHPPRLEAYARQVAAAAEAVRGRVLARVGVDPGRTFILVNDETDVFNGYAVPDPHPFIRVYATFPRPTDIGAQWQDSLVALVGHEFAHVADLTVRDDLRLAARSVFGPAPGLLGARVTPAWLLEGYAVYLEGEVTTGGRTLDATVRTLRAQVAREGEWPSLADASIGPLERWPYGNTRYAFGAGFVPFLMRKAGEEGLRRAVLAYNRTLLDFSGAWQEANGTSLAALWEEWTGEERARAAREERDLAGTGLPVGARLAGPGASRPAVRQDGATVWWEGGALRFRGPSGFPERVPLPARPDRLSWAPDGTIVYARLTAQGARTTGELYRLTTDGVERRVASSGRARDAAADGECVLYVRETPDGSSLRRACPSGDALVYEAPAGWHLSTPAPGPGGALALTIWRPGGFLDVALLRGGRLELVTSDAAQDMEPAWGEGGRLFFTSDRGGSFQLHEASAAGLVRLSAAPGGVYSPSVAAGRAYFTSYGGEGVEVRGLDLPARGLPAATARAEPVPLAELAGGQYPVVPYAAELTAFWAPAGPSGPGATVFASDPAGVHYLVASGGYSLATAGPEATLVYTLTPALGWQVGASAALEGASFTALASVANAGRAESQATGAFDYRFSVQAGLAAGRPEAMAALLLDALREDAFGYPESGWSLSLRASTSGAAGAHGRAAGSVAGVPLLVDGRLAGSHASATASLTVTARFSLRPQWRLGDGIVSLERVSVLPAFGVEHRLGQSGWLVGTTVALDGALHYHAPVTLGVQLQYRSLGGFSVALVTQVPLLEALTLVPKFGEPPPAPGLGWSSKEGP